MERIGSAWAIGRDIHVGDTIIGIKGRVGFESAAPPADTEGPPPAREHHTYQVADVLEGADIQLVRHDAARRNVLEPVMRDLEAFLESTQQNVTGKVYLELHPYYFDMVGIDQHTT